MYDTYTPTRTGGVAGWFRRAEAWLDDRGRPAWIVAMVLGFVIFWPVGLALLAYMIWSKRMFSRSCTTSRRHALDTLHRAQRSSGNTAFDAYKADTLRRLQDEQEAFEAFLQRLRDAKDKTEFDTFMADRARANTAPEMRPEPRNTNPAAGY
jgi:heme/copper-type cytochrome/quinol oxidase subunit 1